jgi:hypothetical protein
MVAFGCTNQRIRKLSGSFAAHVCRGLMQAGGILMMTGAAAVHSGT